MKAIIVDDEHLSREKVKQLLVKHKDVEIAAYCENGEEALNEISESHPDLVFLDIQMPGMTGIELIDALDNHPDLALPQIIFITAYDEHAIKAFEINAVDYLLKPIKSDRFDLALERCRERFKDNIASSEEKYRLFHAYREALKSKFISATHLGKVYPLKAADIIWAKAEGNYVKIFTEDRFYMKRTTLSEFETSLNSREILRIHKSHLVNTNHIDHFEPYFHSDLLITLKSGEKIKCSRNFADELKKVLG